jgi:hypothetical protein
MDLEFFEPAEAAALMPCTQAWLPGATAPDLQDFFPALHFLRICPGVTMTDPRPILSNPIPSFLWAGGSRSFPEPQRALLRS